MKQLFLLITFLLIPAVAQTPPLELDIVFRTSGTAAETRQFCRRFALTKGYPPKVRDEQGNEIDNPETPCNAAERYLEEYVLREIKESAGAVAEVNARQAARQQIDNELKGKKKERQ